MLERARQAWSGGRRLAWMSEMAAAERIERGCLGTLLRLTPLAPDIMEAVLDGRQPAALAVSSLMESFAAEWERQHTETGRADRPA